MSKVKMWLPLFIGDFHSARAGLNSNETKAYVLLLCYYWQHEGLPSDDDSLSLICEMSPEQWAASKGKLATRFEPQWKHSHLDSEFSRAQHNHTMAQRRGEASQAKRRKASIKSYRDSLIDGFDDCFPDSHEPSPSPEGPTQESTSLGWGRVESSTDRRSRANGQAKSANSPLTRHCNGGHHGWDVNGRDWNA